MAPVVGPVTSQKVHASMVRSLARAIAGVLFSASF